MALKTDEKLIKNALLFVALLENKDTEVKTANILKLIDDGSNIDARDANNHNNTPLHIATLKEDKIIVELLLNKGAGLYKNDEGKTPLDIAKDLCTNEGKSIVDIFTRDTGTMNLNGQSKLELNNKTEQSISLHIHNIIDHKCKNAKSKLTYKKRAGTSGVTGQLYETKLLSLILFRALNIKEIEEFYLGTNIDGVGVFDDICLRFKIRGEKKQFAVFMQAKHRDDPRKGKIKDSDLYDTKSDFNLIKYFDSYIRIKERFTSNKSDVMFNGNLSEVISDFVIYTPAMDNVTIKENVDANKNIRDLILSHDTGNAFQIQYENDDVEFLGETLAKEHIKILAKTILSDINTYQMIINDEVILRYHIFLAQRVIEVSDCDSEGFCNGKFRPELFCSNDDLLITLKEALYTEALQKAKIRKEEIKESLFAMINHPCAISISKLILNVVKFDNKNNNLDFIETNVPEDIRQFKQDLQRIKVTHETIKDAIELAGKEKLQSMTFKLPAGFGVMGVKENESKLNTESNDWDLGNHYKILAKEFLSKLWFYTNQAKENEVENILKKEIDCQLNADKEINQSVFSVQSSAIFLKFHDAVQKWWMRPNKAYFLTKTCEYYNNAKAGTIFSPLLNILNLVYINKLKKNDIEFSENSIKAIKLDKFTTGFLNIITHANVLSSIKLYQYFKNLNIDCFVDFDYVLRLPLNEFNTITAELRITVSDAVIISIGGTDLCEKLKLVLSEVYEKKVILVTGEVLAAKLKKYLNSYFDVRDEKNGFVDLTPKSQRKILEEVTIIFQGEEVFLNTVISDDSNHLIKADVLSKLVNNERIAVGMSLLSPSYDDSKDYYVHRNIRKGESVYKVKTLLDLEDEVLVITATPGMGKSTLLTHLSVQTKKAYPKKWIARINLLDCSRKFHEWQEKSTNVIDVKETVALICEVLINDTNKYNKVNFELEERNSELILKDCTEIRGSALLELQLFIYFYNNGEIIFLFDGFDEICPHYESEALQMIQSLTIRPQNHGFMTAATSALSKGKVSKNHRIWITSRPYNDIIQRLEYEFGESYSLEPLSNNDQRIFFEKHWKAKINLQELSYEQFEKIDSFFEYMARFCQPHDDDQNIQLVSLTSVPLHTMYVYAIEYLRNEIKTVPLTADKEEFRQRWNSNAVFPTLIDQYLNLAKVLTFSGTPLHMYIAADCFQSEIKDHFSLSRETDENISKWDLDVNTFRFYERFLETKLKKIRFVEKNDMEIFKPDIKMIYEKELKEFIDKHKKLAMYAIFEEENLNNLISNEELNEINCIMNKIQLGEEKTGLVCSIINGVPRFVHLVFAEYFAVEYICDLLKTIVTIEKRVILWDFILNILLFNNHTGVIFDHKLIDTALVNVIENNADRKIVFDLWMEQNKFLVPVLYKDNVLMVKSRTILHKAFSKCLKNSATFLINCLDGNLNNSNVDIFIEIIKSDRFFLISALFDCNELIERVLNKLRTFGLSKVKSSFIGDDLIYCPPQTFTNEEIINSLNLRAKDITPY